MIALNYKIKYSLRFRPIVLKTESISSSLIRTLIISMHLNMKLYMNFRYQYLSLFKTLNET